MLKKRLDMVGDGISFRLPLLGHDIAYVNLECMRRLNCLHNPIHQQIGDDAGIEAPRAQQQYIRIPDGCQSLRQRPGVLRHQTHSGNPAVLPFFTIKNFGLPHHGGTVFKKRLQLDIRRCHRQYPACDGQNLAHSGHCRIKGGRNPIEGCQKQISKALSS